MPLWAWISFAVVVTVLMAVDLVVHRRDTTLARRDAIVWTFVWIASGLAFGAAIWAHFGSGPGYEYFAAYAIEKGLSVDNLFVFLVIFRTFGLDDLAQRRVLHWGILGALVLRGLFIFLGLEALRRLAWVHWVFGGILVLAAIHAFREGGAGEGGDGDARFAEIVKRRLPLARGGETHHFFVREAGKLMATPAFAAMIAIELTDVAFAIDSVPAALSVSTEPFIVYSSNIFAILGLRALYTVLSTTLAHLRYLHFGVAAVLAFAAIKIIGIHWFHISAPLSVGIIVVLIAVPAIASVIADRRERHDATA